MNRDLEGLNPDILDELKVLSDKLESFKSKELEMFKELIIKLGGKKEDVERVNHDTIMILPYEFDGACIPVHMRDKIIVSKYIDQGSMILYNNPPKYEPVEPVLHFRAPNRLNFTNLFGGIHYGA